jgi:type III secretion protein D
LQAGASLTLASGEYVLGTDESCDLILMGRQIMPRHARLSVDSDVMIYPDEGSVIDLSGNMLEGQLLPGTLFRLGNTWLTIDFPDAPWPDVDTLFEDMKPTIESMGSAVDAIPMPAEDIPSYDDDLAVPAYVEEMPPPPARWQSRGFKALVAALVLGVTVLCIILAFNGSESEQDRLKSSAQAAIEKEKAQMTEILKKMRLNQRITVSLNQQGKFVMAGYLATDEDMSVLVGELAKLKVRPELRLHSEQSIVNAANQILLTTKLPIKAINLGMGRLQLIGAANGYESVDTLMQRMSHSIDGLRGMDSEILVGDQLVGRLRQMIIDNGFSGKVMLTINNGEAIVNGALDMQEMAQWETMMAKFVATYGTILPIRASFPPTANMLPFKILSAFSGDIPFVVTDRSDKIMLGGKIMGYTLTNITETEIVFDGPKKVQIQR